MVFREFGLSSRFLSDPCPRSCRVRRSRPGLCGATTGIRHVKLRCVLGRARRLLMHDLRL